ncbi:MAG: EI24 domain-containing protein, partial [Campylobacteraceae bacterium]
MNYEIFNKSLKDFLSGKFLTLSFAPLLAAAIVLSILMVLGVKELLDLIQTFIDTNSIDPVFKEEYPWLVKILSYGFVHWIISAIFFTFGSLLVVVFSIVIAVLVLGFLTPTVVKTLHQKYYSHLPLPKETLSVSKTLLITLFIFLKFIGLLLICIPFMFIPLVNIIAFNAPFYYLFHKLMVFDVASNIFDESSYKKAIEPFKMQLIVITFCFFILALIPVLGLFLQLFFAIYLTHYIFLKVL